MHEIINLFMFNVFFFFKLNISKSFFDKDLGCTTDKKCPKIVLKTKQKWSSNKEYYRMKFFLLLKKNKNERKTSE